MRGRRKDRLVRAGPGAASRPSRRFFRLRRVREGGVRHREQSAASRRPLVLVGGDGAATGGVRLHLSSSKGSGMTQCPILTRQEGELLLPAVASKGLIS